MSNEIAKVDTAVAAHYRQATDVAGVCGEIVKRTAQNIQGRKYVKVEGWQAIATAHGCVASSRDVEKVAGGWRAVGELRRLDTGQIIAQAEGFLGEDEPVWAGGTDVRGKTYPKRPEYACRAMAQTRAISRVCRSAFAHVVVLIDGDLSTTPAEEVPFEGFDDKPSARVKDAPPVETIRNGKLTPEEKADNAAGFDRPKAPAKVLNLPPLVDKGNPFSTKAVHPQLDGMDFPPVQGGDPDREVILRFQGKGQPPIRKRAADLTNQEVDEFYERLRFRWYTWNKKPDPKFGEKNKQEILDDCAAVLAAEEMREALASQADASADEDGYATTINQGPGMVPPDKTGRD